MKLNRFYGLITLIIPFFIAAQQNYKLTKLNNFYSFISVEISNNEPLVISENILFTSIKLEFQQPTELPLKIGYKKTDGSQNYLTAHISDHADEGFNGSFSTPLQVFETPQKEVKLDFGNIKGYVKIHLFYAKPINGSIVSNLKKTTNPCDKPQMISYTEWRAGLPDPKPPREATEVEHLVVHHSAGSNTDTNYINTVRNIYLLHTQSNGWDDIGYNFLIAPNGLIFKGRDPQGVADEDNILGAHFCGKNQNTMGVCLMGDFMNARPTEKAVFSLKYLLAWKLKKDRINAFGQTNHPKPSGSLLNNLCGHRDGCSTDCPGDSLYAMLPKIKAEASRIADSCGLTLSHLNSIKNKGVTIFPNPSQGFVTLSINNSISNPSMMVYGLAGNLVFYTSFTPNIPFEIPLCPGLYFYKLLENKAPFHQSILKIEQ